MFPEYGQADQKQIVIDYPHVSTYVYSDTS